MMREQAIRFECEGQPLIGILHLPAQAGSRAVVIVTGGPQYRVGSHRQFVLLARHLAQHGIVVMRFDYRGMGDSHGEPRGFLAISADLRAAIEFLLARVPSRTWSSGACVTARPLRACMQRRTPAFEGSFC